MMGDEPPTSTALLAARASVLFCMGRIQDHVIRTLIRVVLRMTRLTTR